MTPKTIDQLVKAGHSPKGGVIDGIVRGGAGKGRRPLQKARTLMNRGAVKPIVNLGKHLIDRPNTSSIVTPATMVHQTPESKLKKALHFKQSHLISKFSIGQANGLFVKKTAPLSVEPVTKVSEPSASNDDSELDVHSSYAQKRASKKKAIGLAATALVFGLFVFYQNVSLLKLRVASAKAGIGASLPGYRPDGFSVGPINYKQGQVVIDFKSKTSAQSFQVKQSDSDWNSEALLSNFVAQDRKPYQTYQEQGKTIFVYNDSAATWVDGGVWYLVEGDAKLGSDQLLRIARSL